MIFDVWTKEKADKSDQITSWVEFIQDYVSYDFKIESKFIENVELGNQHYDICLD